MNALGAAAYRRTGVDTAVAAASPHALVLMLFDAVLEAIRQAEGHLQAGQVAQKGVALGKAVRIVEEGLKASVDRSAGGALAGQLVSLYDYATLRLLQANLRNDDGALREVASLLSGLRAAWAQIGAPAEAGTGSAPAADLARGRGALPAYGVSGEPVSAARVAAVA